MTELHELSAEVIAERVAQLRQEADPLRNDATSNTYRYVKPFTEAADTFIDTLENPGQNIMLGLGPIDVLTRGFRAAELVMVTGFSHSGKTQLCLQMIAKNYNKRILFFSLDDPAPMLLAKLVSVHHGIPGDELEKKLSQHDEFYRDVVQQTAARDFDKLIVIDEPLRLDEMEAAIDEAAHLWGAPPDLVIIDYLALMPTEGGYDAGDGYARTAANARSLKRWIKDKAFPMVCIHQATRGAGGPGKAPTLVSTAYGGEQEATILIGVRRKLFDESLDLWQREHERNTVTVHVIKNKRPPNRRTNAEGIDFHLDESTGAIRRLRDEDLSQPPQPVERSPLPEEARMFADLEAEVVGRDTEVF